MSASPAYQGTPAVRTKKLLSELLIAFMLAFVFRGFVVEGFVIPTGSMAPTLLGKHVRFHSPHNGYEWATGPWDYADRTRRVPLSAQGAGEPMNPMDPMTGLSLPRRETTNRALASGDRVFVLKYLPVLHEPRRWDVVVFKNPGSHENYIKRLVGLPGEQIAIVDGDIFTRPFVEGETAPSGWDAWAQDDWEIARKSERVQRAMLVDVVNSRFAPIAPDPAYRSPWVAGAGWDGVRSGSSYAYTGSGDTSLEWSGAVPLTDRNAYNQNYAYRGLGQRDEPREDSSDPFWARDLALASEFEVSSDTLVLRPEIACRGMVFRAVLECAAGAARLERRAEGSDAWEPIDEGVFPPQSSGDLLSVEFWHTDQALWLFVDGVLVAGGPREGAYTMSPLETVLAATGLPRGTLESGGLVDPESGREIAVDDGVTRPGVLSVRSIYREPGVRWSMSGGGFTMHNVRVRRDIHYRNEPTNFATRGGHPDFFPTLSRDAYFMCGDNSAFSADSRAWTDRSIVPWVRETIADTPGVVDEDLIVGKAFVVYWPSLLDDGVPFAPDIGRVRWIW